MVSSHWTKTGKPVFTLSKSPLDQSEAKYLTAQQVERQAWHVINEKQTKNHRTPNCFRVTYILRLGDTIVCIINCRIVFSP